MVNHANHGTPLPIGHFAKLAGVITANFPREMEDPQLALDLAKHGDAVEIILWNALTRANLDAALAKLGKAAKKILSILRFIQVVLIPARTEKFIPKDRYTKNNPDVQFGYIDPEFIDDFGDMVEEPTSEIALRQYASERQSRFDLAMEEVAGEGFITETTPGILYSMLEKQPKGPRSDEGPLLTNTYANLFKMVNRKGVARLVNARWGNDHGGWGVYSGPAMFLGRWDVEDQLFSRDSRLPLAT